MSKKLPWDKFTYSDWIGDVELQMCSLAAQGLWMSMLCLMWDSVNRGRLVDKDGKPMDLKTMSFVLRHSQSEVEPLLKELIDGGVCSVDDQGVVYCRRMVRDQQTRESDTSRKTKYRPLATTLRQPCDNIATTLRQPCDTVEGEGEEEKDKEHPKGGCISDGIPPTPPTEPVDNSGSVDNFADSPLHPPENLSEDISSSPADWRLLVDDEDFCDGITRICERIETVTGSPYSETRRRWTAHAACDVFSDAVGGDPVAAVRGLGEFVDALCGDRHPKGFDVAGFLDGLAKYPDRIFPPDGNLSRRCQVLMAIRQYAELHKQTRTALRRLWVGIKKREGAMAGG